jgi:nitrate/nitrite transporter NarK
MDLRDLRDRRALVVVFGAMAAQMAMGSTYARGALTPSLVEELGWSRGDLMTAASPGTWMTGVASPIAGWLTQRYGARPVVTVGVLLPALLGWGFSELRELWQLFVLSVATGCMIASVGDVAVGSVVAKWIHAGRGLALGIVYSGSNLGGSLLAMAATLMLGPFGWRNAFLFVGLACSALLLPIVLSTVREPRADFLPTSLAGDAAAEQRSQAAEGIRLREAVRTPSFWLLFTALFLFYVYFLGVNAHFTLYLVDIGFSRVQAGQLLAELVFLGVLAKLGIGLIADRWPAKTALLLNFGLVVIASFLLLGIESDRALVRPFVTAHGLATMAQNVVFPLIVAWCFGTRYMAEIYGMLMLALLPGGTIGPIALGYMHDWLGSYDLAFQVLAGLNLLCFAMLAAVRPFRSLNVRSDRLPDARAAG